MNEHLLEEIGLTKGEIKVYFTLLKIGETTTGKIVEEAQISSGKIYEILEKLIKKGLVGFIVKEKTKYFNAASPRRIIDYLEEKEKGLKQKKREIESQISNFLRIKKIEASETILFKGLGGIQTAIFKILENLTKEDEVLAMGLVSNKDEKYNILWEKWHNKRVSKKVRCRLIFSERGEYYKNLSRTKFMDTRVIEELTPSPINITKDNVLIFTYGDEPSCLYIKNSEIAESFRSFFETMWKIAKK